MKAMFIREFGGPEVFEKREAPKPEPRATELLVKVYATSVNPVDLGVRRAGSWAVEPPASIGYDVSGVVEAVGSEVEEFGPGDEVYYTPEIVGGQGSYAEFHVVDASIAARKPKNLTHAEAASIPLAGGTAWGALIPRAQLWVGETALIHGGGGVGSLAVQIAKAAGAYVFAVCSDCMVPLLKDLGADRAINYKTEDFVEVVREETNGEGVNVVLDTVGGDTLARSLEVAQPFSDMVGIVRTDTGFGGAAAKNINLNFMFIQRDRYQLDVLRALLEREQITPVIDSVLPLSDVAEAHRRLESGGVKGKIVLSVREE